MTGDPISKKTLARLPLYLGYLREQKGGDQPYISATTIADALGLNQVQVRKDLALISSGGKPKVGYRISELEADIERFLGYDNINSAVIVGAGHLGKALMSYVGWRSSPRSTATRRCGTPPSTASRYSRRRRWPTSPSG